MAELGDGSDKHGSRPNVSHTFVLEIDRQSATGTAVNSHGCVLGGRIHFTGRRRRHTTAVVVSLRLRTSR